MLIIITVLTAMALGAIILLFFLNFISALKEHVIAAIFIAFLAGTCFYLASKL